MYYAIGMSAPPLHKGSTDFLIHENAHVYVIYKPWPRGVYMCRYTPACEEFVPARGMYQK